MADADTFRCWTVGGSRPPGLPAMSGAGAPPLVPNAAPSNLMGPGTAVCGWFNDHAPSRPSSPLELLTSTRDMFRTLSRNR